MGAAKCERKRGTVEKQATGTKRSADDQRGHAGQAHTKARKQPRFAHGVPPAPAREDSARERAAHNSPRQSAWVVVFVGVFADVCRLFWLVGFGGLGVFWGCLACFLVF